MTDDNTAVISICSLERCNTTEVATQLRALNGQTINGLTVTVEETGCIGACGYRQRVDLTIGETVRRYGETGVPERERYAIGTDPVATLRTAIETHHH